MPGLDIVWVRQFFLFKCQGHIYPGIVIQWYSHCGDVWVIEPDIHKDSKHIIDKIHLDTIVHSSHLITVY